MSMVSMAIAVPILREKVFIGLYQYSHRAFLYKVYHNIYVYSTNFFTFNKLKWLL